MGDSWKQEDWVLHRFSTVAEPREGGGKDSSSTVDQVNVECQADGCLVNLVELKKKYYTRYRVCPDHQKAMCSIVGGEKKRFCQQCGKFHALAEFDGNKKSCIARLEKHNVRRKRLREIQHMLKSRGYIDRDALRQKYNISDKKLAAMEAKAKAKLGMMRKGGNSLDSVLHSSKESDVSTSTDEKDSQSRKSDSVKGYVPMTDQSSCVEISSPESVLPVNADLDLLQDSYLDPVVSSVEQQSDMHADILYLSDERNSWDLDELYGPTRREYQPNSTFNNDVMSVGAGGKEVLPGCADLCQEILRSVDNPLSHPEWDQELFSVACKLDKVTPADLTPGVGSGLEGLCDAHAVEGYMRPGCVYLQADAIVEKHKYSTCMDVREKAEKFLRSTARADGTPITKNAILQIDEHLVYTDGNNIRQIFSLRNAGNLLPALTSVSSLAIVAQREPVEIIVECERVRSSDNVFVRSRGEHLETHLMSIETRDKSQSLFISVFGCVKPGVLQVELNRGPYTTAAQLVVLCTNAEEADEVKMLGVGRNACLRTILYKIGMIMEAKDKLAGGMSHEDVAREYKRAPKSPSKSARALIPLLMQRKMHHLLESALEAYLCSNRDKQVLMSSIEESCMESTGMTLLQHAVKSQSVEVLQCILSWGQRYGLSLECCREGRGKTTALHLAVMVKDKGHAAELLTQYCVDAIDGWEGAKSIDGTSPIALATLVGNAEEIESRISVGAEKNELLSAQEKDTLCKKTWYRVSGSKTTISGQEQDSEGKEMGVFLEYSSQYLEEQYKVWFNRRRVTIDLSVLAMTIFSQGLALYTGEYSTSMLAWISAIILLLYSTVVVGSSFWSQEMYTNHREWLCVGFTLLHTMLHVLTYGSSPSRRSALIQGSSLLQVIMLTFGLRPRFKALVICLTAMLPMTALLNSSVCSTAFGDISTATCLSNLLVYQVLVCLIVPSCISYKSEVSMRQSFLDSRLKSKKLK
mmetsp:Transcript_8848/g.17592  ORF Transcript_8848/g.17592 Transcript_8848/m.17592 type:complete len:978 (+) Transcript_8848:171-3104(+)|eukprot:CAMPEP_0118807484 /NCGR_PEP_ID=MMETSP1161-20130426/35491_1 /TAXON_ID=249345 /ORGANISM="Picochlorum oklahomensis, Strain CCMP2329" /LENGTH=977 /DNA_ID=CAMNT_0006736851 /DNA_START=157 /DNA_END=3090 /DNA_ORIENTATION=+